MQTIIKHFVDGYPELVRDPMTDQPYYEWWVDASKQVVILRLSINTSDEPTPEASEMTGPEGNDKQRCDP